MARRIDALYCTHDTASRQIDTIIAEVKSRAITAQQDVKKAIEERKQALAKREAELNAQIDKLMQSKVVSLNQQLQSIAAGTWPPAPAEDPDQEPDPNIFLLDADAVINFRIGEEEDFLDKIDNFGKIGESSTYASLSYAQGPALGMLKTENPTYLWIYSCDRLGAKRTEGGDTVTVTLSSPEDFQDLEVEDCKDGRYKVKFVPSTPGTFTLDVVVSSDGGDPEPLRGSPFELNVRGPTNYEELAYNSDVKTGSYRILGEVGRAHNSDKLGAVHHPTGVDFDPTGQFAFVVDQSNHRIQIFDMETEQAVHQYGSKGFGANHFDMPANIAVGRNGQLIVTDLLNHRVQVLSYGFVRDPATQERQCVLANVASIGHRGGAEGEFQFPKGMTITEHGHFLVCDSGNHRVQVFSMDDCQFQCMFGSFGTGEGQFETPLDAAVNFQGEILVSDSTNRIQVFDAQYNFLRSFGRPGGREMEFQYPVGLCVNDENGLFICDLRNHRIQVVEAFTGEFLCRWKGGRKPAVEGEDPPPDDDGGDGATEPPWLGIHSPWGIAVNTHGAVVVTDYEQGLIFRYGS